MVPTKGKSVYQNMSKDEIEKFNPYAPPKKCCNLKKASKVLK